MLVGLQNASFKLMTLPTRFITLVARLNQEFDRTEQEATEGLNLARAALSRFPDNVLLIQFFAYLNDVLMFVEISRRQLQVTLEIVSATDVPAEVVQDAGEELATLIGRVLEAKIDTSRITTRLQDLS